MQIVSERGGNDIQSMDTCISNKQTQIELVARKPESPSGVVLGYTDGVMGAKGGKSKRWKELTWIFTKD